MQTFKAQIYRDHQFIDELRLNESVVVGRQDPKAGDHHPISLTRTAKPCRLVVGDQQCVSIPRSWFDVQADANGTVLIRNLHEIIPLPISHDEPLACGTFRSFEREVLIDLGNGIAIRFSPVHDLSTNENEAEYRTLNSAPPVPGQSLPITLDKSIDTYSTLQTNNISNLLRLALDVVQKAAGSDAFFQAAVSATMEIAALTRTILFLAPHPIGSLQTQTPLSSDLNDGWWIAAENCDKQRTGSVERRPVSSSLLKRVRQDRATVIHNGFSMPTKRADGGHGMAHSLDNVECAVASPILNQNREVIGILYGDRATTAVNTNAHRISDFEATLVEILAGSVAGGIARQAEERNRSRLAEFFSPKVINLLATKPELMEGQDAEVSVLFCDIRGFSSATERLGPRKAFSWINDVMTELSRCVIDHDGVLVDYVGDELFAMWGAPGEQLDHAALATYTALAMLQAIETLRERWRDILPQRFGAGIGVNTGPARVGNVGSRQKFKYGPLGNTVNLGSRLQSATKQLGVDCLVSLKTAQMSGCLSTSRRLAKLKVAGIDEPVEVFQIVCDAGSDWTELVHEYQLALTDFENQQFREAARRLGALLPRFPDDRPCRKLLSRSVAELDEPTENFDGVWRLNSK